MDEETVGIAEGQDVAENTAETTEVSSPEGDSYTSTDTGVDNAAAPPPSDYFSSFRGLPDFAGLDDRSIAGRLYQALEREKTASAALAQYQQIIPYAQDFLANKSQYEAWRRAQVEAQQKAANPPKPEEKPWWSPPEVREAYKQYLVKDESGREIISPEAPLDARHALYEYQQYKADFAKKFLENPEATLAPVIERVATQKAQAIVEQQFNDFSQKGYVANLEAENADWLLDANGNASPEGVAVQKYIEDAKQLGITSPEARWAYATSMVERDLLNRAYSQLSQPAQPAPAPAPRPAPAPVAKQPEQQQTQDQRNMEFLRKEASRTPSRSSSSTGESPSIPSRKSFEQLLREQAASDGLL